MSATTSFDYVRSYYGVPAKRGLRVTVDGKPGVITRGRGHYIMVRLDGWKHSRPCHPTWRVDYAPNSNAGSVVLAVDPSRSTPERAEP